MLLKLLQRPCEPPTKISPRPSFCIASAASSPPIGQACASPSASATKCISSPKKLAATVSFRRLSSSHGSGSPVRRVGFVGGDKYCRWRSIGAAATSRAYLLEATGLSVISDIDERSNILTSPANARSSRTLSSAPTKPSPAWPRSFASGGPKGPRFTMLVEPLELYEHLTEHLADEGFPSGSFHLKAFRLRDHLLRRVLMLRRSGKLSIIRSLFQMFPRANSSSSAIRASTIRKSTAPSPAAFPSKSPASAFGNWRAKKTPRTYARAFPPPRPPPPPRLLRRRRTQQHHPSHRSNTLANAPARVDRGAHHRRARSSILVARPTSAAPRGTPLIVKVKCGTRPMIAIYPASACREIAQGHLVVFVRRL